ncbi:MAG: cytochrome c [Rhodospirillales bacterium]|nr:cytochrome c [Rhodospirillales bacterium]
MSKNAKLTLLGVALLALIAGGAALLTIFGSSSGTQGTDAGNLAVVAAGEKLYARTCASCHGANLEGQKNWRQALPDGGVPAPPHDKTGHTWHHTDKLLFDYTKLGGAAMTPKDFKSNMPGFADILSDSEIWAVLSFIKSRWPEQIRLRQDAMSKRQ